MVAALYMEGGGVFQPVPGVDYLSYSDMLTFGNGTVVAEIDMALYEE